jgi:hypothetical protein
MHFYIGYYVGAITADNDDANGSLNGILSCPSGHTDEYYAGYNTGYFSKALSILAS